MGLGVARRGRVDDREPDAVRTRYVAPGRLRYRVGRGVIDLSDLKAVVLNEADEMLVGEKLYGKLPAVREVRNGR